MLIQLSVVLLFSARWNLLVRHCTLVTGGRSNSVRLNDEINPFYESQAGFCLIYWT